MLLPDLVQMADQDRVLLLQQGYFVLQRTSLLALVQCYGLDQLLKVHVLALEYLLELVVLVYDLLADRDRV